MRRVFFPILLFLLLCFLLLAVPTVSADVVELQALKDNTLYEPISQNGFADTSNALGANMFIGQVKDALNQTGQVAVRRAVLAFQIAGNIPPGATIDSVQLTMVVNKAAQTNSFGADLHRLLEDWGEGTSNTGNSQQGRGEPPTTDDATWNHTFYPGSFWSVAGGVYSMSTSASTLVGGTGTYNWGSTSGMVADVQSWLDNPTLNFGWIVIGNESQIETAKRFATRENTSNSGLDRPKLLINYTPTGGPTGACCAPDDSCTVVDSGTCVSPDTYQGDSTTCSSHPCAIPIGACCAGDGTCSETEQVLCEAGGGVYQADGSTCAAAECPIALTPFIDPLPIPGVALPTSGAPDAAATYDISMVEFTQQMHSELPGPTTVWGYQDSITAAAPHTPGPIIVARSGQPVTVNWINDLRVGGGVGPLRTNHYLGVDVQEDGLGNVCIHGAEDNAKAVVHLHGGHVPSAVDGYPESTFLPGSQAAYCVTDEFIVCTDDLDCPGPGQCDGDGASCTADTDCVGHGGNQDCQLCQVGYTYPNEQQAGFLWFHDHALGITRLNVMMGLAGAYLVRDSVEDAINIPGGEFEVPLVIQDRKFNPDGSLNYPAAWQDMWFGDKIIVNGAVWPYLDVKQGKYRFRLLNGSTSRVYTLSLNPPSGLLTFTVVGTEGGLLEAPVNGVGQLTIGPGERYDVVVDFGGYNIGDEILLENGAPAPFPGGSVDVTDVMKFVVSGQVGDIDALPATLRPIERLQEADAILSRDFRLKRSGTDGCGRSIWEINELHWDDITEYPDLGTTEIWRFINDSNVSHPMHMHLVFFQILDREGFTTDAGGNVIPDGNVQPPLAEENGWKDTAMVGPNEILRVIARFENYKGKYAYHCHILEHEDHEMMRQFQTVDCGDAELDVTESCDDGNLTSYDGCSGTCAIEEHVELAGIAAGGGPPRVDVTVSGELIRVTTTAGQTAAQVAQAIADAINANANLQALGVTAAVVGNRVVTNGDITAVEVGDSGLSDVLHLTAGRTQLWWGNVEAATGGYDVVKGDLVQLRATLGDFSDPLATQACYANDQTATFVDLSADNPGAGEVYWYLLRSQPGGSFESGGSGQVGTRDTEIGTSGNGCP